MSDLTAKFEAFESQIATNHTEVANALDSILTALGAPPPTATVTLADISNQLSSLNDTLTDIISGQTSYFASSLEVLGLMNTSLETINNNASLNAQRLISAIYATFCECDTTTPLLSPPLDVTPTELVDEAKCRRIQFYLSVFGNWLNKIANYGASGAAITGGTLAELLAAVVADAGIVATGVEVGAAAGPPGMVVGAVVTLIAVAVFALGGNILQGYAADFNDPTLRDNMVQAMYAATNADEGYTAFKSTLLAGMDTIPAEIIYTLWWSAWSNDIYSGVPTVDDSAFDGSICIPATTCIDWTIEQMVTVSTSFGDRIIPVWSLHGYSTTSGTVSGDLTAVMGDWSNWTYTATGKGLQFIKIDGLGDAYMLENTSASVETTVTDVIPAEVGSFRIILQSYVEPFTLELCEPTG